MVAALDNRVLPMSLEAEQAVVGSVLRDPAVALQIPFLHPEHFTERLLGLIFGTVVDLAKAGKPADWRAVGALFEGRIETATQAVHDLARNASLPALAVPDVARSVRALADRRAIIQLAEDYRDQAYEGGTDPSQLAASFATELATRVGDSGGDVVSYRQLAEQIVSRLNDRIPRYSTGLATLDYVLAGGLYVGKVYGVLARMKVGKTLLGSSVAFNVAMEIARMPELKGQQILYLPLEMGAEALAQAVMARRMRINSLAFLNEAERFDPAFQAKAADAAVIGDVPLLFQTGMRRSLDGLKQTIARCALRDGVVGVVIDYLQLVTGRQRGQNQAEFLEEISNWMHEAAKTFGLWIMVLAQENQGESVLGGEGLLRACDCALRLHRVEGSGVPKQADKAWLETMMIRYANKRQRGTDDEPSFIMDTGAGPHFSEIYHEPEPSAQDLNARLL